MASGEAIGCFGLTEPDFGSDPGGMITRAVQARAASYVLNGAKMWITNGTVAHLAIVWAKLKNEASGKRGDPRLPRREGHEGLLRARAEAQALAARLGHQRADPAGRARAGGQPAARTSSGLKGPLGCLSQARFGIAFGVVGAAMACFHSAAEYSQEPRDQFGKPIGSLPARAERARRHAHRDHQGAAALRPARAAQGARRRSSPSRSRSPSATTARSRSTSRAARATSWAPTASPPSTR